LAAYVVTRQTHGDYDGAGDDQGRGETLPGSLLDLVRFVPLHLAHALENRRTKGELAN